MEEQEEDSDKKKDRELVLEGAVRKEMYGLPETIRSRFLLNLEMVRLGLTPVLAHEKLHAAGEGVVELKINGRPAWRCMYVVRKNGDVVALHATSKTSNGQDRQLIKTTSLRLKRLVPDR